MNLEQHLMTLSEAAGISGYEAPVWAIIEDAWDELADDLTVDRLGTLLATRSGTNGTPRRKILVTAHMDEIGLMVTRIEDEFLRVSSVGGIDKRVLLSQPVIVHGNEPIPGLIGSRPPHVLAASERNSYPGYDDLVIDTGYGNRKLKQSVPIGSPVTFAQPAVKLASDVISGKAMDNRASIACMTQLLTELQTRAHGWDVLVAATVQEEVTLGGGRTVAWRTQPDLAIIVDTTWATGNGVGEDDGFKLGGGPSIAIGPNAHPKLFDLLRSKARTLEIDLHPEPLPRSSGTEAWAVQVTRDGVPCAILSIPIRNMHTPVEIVDLKDIRRVARLIAAFIVDLDDSTLDRIAL